MNCRHFFGGHMSNYSFIHRKKLCKEKITGLFCNGTEWISKEIFRGFPLKFANNKNDGKKDFQDKT